MRAVIQRVSNASVRIHNHATEKIDRGLLIFLGIEDGDTSADTGWLVGKVTKLRIFDDENGVMNLSSEDITGEYLVISQFTLHASTKKGNRPSYIKAARPDTAIPIYDSFIKKLTSIANTRVKTGEFGADMEIQLVNDGPVTILIDTKNKE